MEERRRDARRRGRGLVLLATAGLTAGVLPALAGPAAAVTATEVAEVVGGLNSPRGMTYAELADGTPVLYVAENGLGGEAGAENCYETPADPDGEAFVRCYGPTGSVSMIDLSADDPVAERIVTGLPSLADPESGGAEAIGPSDVSVAPDGSLRIAIGLGANPAERQEYGEGAEALGTLVRFDPATAAGPDDWQVIADIAGYEAAENPEPGADYEPEDGEDPPPDSNPHAVLALEERTLVVDAGGNTLLSVDEAPPALPLPGTGPSYDVTHVEVFPTRMVEAPPEFGLPPGTEIPVESVPTTVQLVGEQVLVSELPGTFAPGDARVYSVDEDPGTEPVVERGPELGGGYTTVADLAPRGDDLFVLQFAAGFTEQGPVGSVVRTRFSEGLGDFYAEPAEEGGTPVPQFTDQSLLTEEGLLFPGGIAVDGDGMVYVTNGGVLPGGGQVLSFDPSLPGDPNIASACAPDEVPGPTYDDIAATVHEEAIACLAWYGIVQGVDVDSFAPEQPITRAQLTTLLAELLDTTERGLPETSVNYFDDDNGGVHESNTNRLAQFEIVKGKAPRRFAPVLDVTRAELASLLVRSYEYAVGEPLPAAGDAFTDDQGSVHAAAIDKAAAQGWVSGVSSDRFDPSRPVTRAQASSMLARMLDDLVADGQASTPQA